MRAHRTRTSPSLTLEPKTKLRPAPPGLEQISKARTSRCPGIGPDYPASRHGRSVFKVDALTDLAQSRCIFPKQDKKDTEHAGQNNPHSGQHYSPGPHVVFFLRHDRRIHDYVSVVLAHICEHHILQI